jgi:predicted nucleic acid-binding protein
VNLHYADTSALLCCWLPGEDRTDGARLRELLLGGAEPVVTSELTRLEVASAVHAAARAGRLRRTDGVLRSADRDWGPGGPVALLALRAADVLPAARQIVLDHPVRTLDAIHLAVATTTATELAAGDPVVFVTRDGRQADAARALGLPVA